jgi:LysR family transcriptional regulator, glycine cleavage system transcriptional activator
MSALYRNLPMGALIGFEAAARLESFSLAAAELNMTQSAVSHQIKALETQLGQPLFRRINRGVELTDAGRDLRATAAATLETLRLGVRRLDFYTKPGSMVVSMSPAFCTGWYLPRLSGLMRDLPGIEPWVVTLDTEQDFTHSEVDFAVRRGPNSGNRGAWDGLVAVKLFDDALQPMCAPTLRDRMPDQTPQALQGFPLLHHEEDEDWQLWFAMNGIARPGFVKGLNFSDAGLALDAAVRGHGICLGSQRLAAERLANGALVAFGSAIPVANATFLLTHPRNLKRLGVAELWEWFVGQI